VWKRFARCASKRTRTECAGRGETVSGGEVRTASAAPLADPVFFAPFRRRTAAPNGHGAGAVRTRGS
jgi:hypothetical protein